VAVDGAGAHDLLSLVRGDRRELRARRVDEGALDHARRASFVEQRDECLAGGELEDRLLRVEGGVGAKRLGRRLYRLLILWRESAQRVLGAVAELPEHVVGNVERVLRDEVDANALGADEPYHLLDLLAHRLRRLVEEQMGLVEEEHQLGLLGVADLGQALEELGEHPQEEGGVERRRLHQLVGGEDVDHALVAVGLEQIVEVERRLAEELVAALLLEREQAALDGADAGGRDVAVRRFELLRVRADVVQ